MVAYPEQRSWLHSKRLTGRDQMQVVYIYSAVGSNAFMPNTSRYPFLYMSNPITLIVLFLIPVLLLPGYIAPVGDPAVQISPWSRTALRLSVKRILGQHDHKRPFVTIEHMELPNNTSCISAIEHSTPNLLAPSNHLASTTSDL